MSGACSNNKKKRIEITGTSSTKSGAQSDCERASNVSCSGLGTVFHHTCQYQNPCTTPAGCVSGNKTCSTKGCGCKEWDEGTLNGTCPAGALCKTEVGYKAG